ncbi:hypothetical protein [Leptotrichia sp. OH3620_COT-345]|uniref:hypothetical protein n=1 Tax=Leptotrichia sp. OH3620_COT-345 TaxID=2491048 RepID=UPI001315A121|nr:hypothetical protein [Leptotrichia sp. OH3620_COT-345]
MKRIIVIVVSFLLILNCSLINEEIKEFEKTKKEMKERGHGCYRGNIHCGYRR